MDKKRASIQRLLVHSAFPSSALPASGARFDKIYIPTFGKFNSKLLMPVGKNKPGKVECLNPQSGRRMNIDTDTWQLFSKAINETLKGGKALSFTELVEGIHDYMHAHKINFKKSIPWYAVTVKNDMEVRGLLKVYTEKGKKMNSLRK